MSNINCVYSQSIEFYTFSNVGENKDEFLFTFAYPSVMKSSGLQSVKFQSWIFLCL